MKKIITLCLSLCMTAALAAPAYALEYSIDAPNDYDFGRTTSIEVIQTADGGAMKNADMGNYQPSVVFTEVSGDLYYKNGSLGRLEIPALDLSVRIYQGTDRKTLAKGIGHFEDTSIWNGNVCLAAHNRGANSYFGQIHTLDIGDKITLTTKLGTRTYKVTDVSKVSETDRSGLADSGENMLTLYTCVRNQRDQRWCVTAVET